MSEPGFPLTRIFPHKGTIEDSILMRENAGKRKPLLWYILHTGYLLDCLRECHPNK